MSPSPSGPDGISSRGDPPAAGRVGALRAGSASLLLHAAVIFAAGWLPLPLVPEQAAPEILSLTLLRPPARPQELDLARAPSRPEPLRDPETEMIEIPEPQPREEIPGTVAPVPSPPVQPEAPEPVEPEAPTPVEPEAPAPAEPQPAPAETPPERLPADVDWDAERRRAVRETIEQRSRYRALGPAEETPGPLERPWDDVDVFEGSGGPSGPSLLEPGKAGSHFGNKLAELCNALTGGGLGLGLNGVGMFALCADSGARSTLFATIKPDYLQSRPVCTEVEQRETLDGTVKKTHDCRLVREEQ